MSRVIGIQSILGFNVFQIVMVYVYTPMYLTISFILFANRVVIQKACFRYENSVGDGSVWFKVTDACCTGYLHLTSDMRIKYLNSLEKILRRPCLLLILTSKKDIWQINFHFRSQFRELLSFRKKEMRMQSLY